MILAMQSRDGHTYYASTTGRDNSTQIVEIDPAMGSGRSIGRMRGQYILHATFVDNGLSFVSSQKSTEVVIRTSDGKWSPITSGQYFLDAAPCGGNVVASMVSGTSSTVVLLDRQGRIVKQMSAGPHDVSAVCSSNGEVLFYSALDQNGYNGSIERCGIDGCHTLLTNGGVSLAISPDDGRLAFLYLGGQGMIVRWMSADGGKIHDITETETACDPEWSSNRTLWVSRRRGEKTVWTEVDVDTGRPTGNVVPGSKDCADAEDDPVSPMRRDVRIAIDHRSQLRLLAERYLPAK
jgi:hypothetical protein